MRRAGIVGISGYRARSAASARRMFVRDGVGLMERTPGEQAGFATVCPHPYSGNLHRIFTLSGMVLPLCAAPDVTGCAQFPEQGIAVLRRR